MKKIGLLICMLMLMGMSSVFANGMTDGVDITGKRYDASVEYKMVPKQPQPDMSERGNYLYLNHNIPICGVSEAAVYYLDLTSCNYYVEDGVAYVSCIVYAGSGGADGQGNPAKIAKKTYRFSTFKNNGQRNIRLLSCVDKNGENVTAREYKWDNGFLYSVFWKSADKVGLSQYLD